MSILGQIGRLERARALCNGPRDGSLFAQLFDPCDGAMSGNQLAEQATAYRLQPEFEYPHTLNARTSDAALRRHFRL